MTPSCSPSSPMSRTSRTRIRSLTRKSLLMNRLLGAGVAKKYKTQQGYCQVSSRAGGGECRGRPGGSGRLEGRRLDGRLARQGGQRVGAVARGAATFEAHRQLTPDRAVG